MCQRPRGGFVVLRLQFDISCPPSQFGSIYPPVGCLKIILYVFDGIVENCRTIGINLIF